MRQYTTPTLNITIKKKSGEVATDLVFDYLIFTIKGNRIRLDKEIQFSEVTEGKFKVRFTQEETGSLKGTKARAEINFFAGEKRLATLIKTIDLDENLIDEVVENG